MLIHNFEYCTTKTEKNRIKQAAIAPSPFINATESHGNTSIITADTIVQEIIFFHVITHLYQIPTFFLLYHKIILLSIDGLSKLSQSQFHIMYSVFYAVICTFDEIIDVKNFPQSYPVPKACFSHRYLRLRLFRQS